MIADVRLKLESDTAPALPCSEKGDSREEPQADASEEQSDSGFRGACGKVQPSPPCCPPTLPLPLPELSHSAPPSARGRDPGTQAASGRHLLATRAPPLERPTLPTRRRTRSGSLRRHGQGVDEHNRREEGIPGSRVTDRDCFSQRRLGLLQDTWPLSNCTGGLLSPWGFLRVSPLTSRRRVAPQCYRDAELLVFPRPQPSLPPPPCGRGPHRDEPWPTTCIQQEATRQRSRLASVVGGWAGVVWVWSVGVGWGWGWRRVVREERRGEYGWEGEEEKEGESNRPHDKPPASHALPSDGQCAPRPRRPTPTGVRAMCAERGTSHDPGPQPPCWHRCSSRRPRERPNSQLSNDMASRPHATRPRRKISDCIAETPEMDK